MSDERDEIRRRIDIVDLVSQRVRLKKSGKNYSGSCPFHEDKSPSFIVSPTIGRYRCYGCGESGDVFNWVMKTQGLEFIDALKQLAELAGVQLKAGSTPQDRSEKERQLAAMEHALLFFRQQLQTNEVAKNYCQGRGIDAAAISEWELGYAPAVEDALAINLKRAGYNLAECQELFLVTRDSSGGYSDKFKGRLMFPIRDDRGDLVGFGGRILGDGIPKYVNSSDTPLYRKSRVLYGYNRAKERMMKDERTILVEGYLDVIACHRAGVTNAVASLGTSFTDEQAKLIKRFSKEVVILYDSDKAGQRAAGKAIEVLTQAGLRSRVALMPDGEDPDTLLRRDGPEAVRNSVERGISPLDFKVLSLENQFPKTDGEFWLNVVELLANAESMQQAEKHIIRLAGQHPDIRDPSAAQRAIRGDIKRIQRAKAPDRRQSEQGTILPTASSSESALHRWEQVVFQSLLVPSLRPRAWQAIGQSDLMLTGRGAELAEALRDAFPREPEGDSRTWLAQCPPLVQDVLTDLDLNMDSKVINQENLDGAISKLEEKREDRERRKLKDAMGEKSASDLRAIQERLKQKQVRQGLTEESEEESDF